MTTSNLPGTFTLPAGPFVSLMLYIPPIDTSSAPAVLVNTALVGAALRAGNTIPISCRNKRSKPSAEAMINMLAMHQNHDLHGMKNIALLVGNGVNALSTGMTWSDLLDKLIREFCTTSITRDKSKPFPLLYEEIFFAALRSGKLENESTLKHFIADNVSLMQENEVHALLRNQQPAHILTANYEYLLEGQQPDHNQGLVKETTFSVFRHHNIDGTKYWHIHGDCNAPNSINLGYEHYCGQLQKMRNYLTGASDYNSKKLDTLPIEKRMNRKGSIGAIQSWLDLFFTIDIHIIGLTLDFVETDLWWLLAYRARLLYYKHSIKQQNMIFYYIPDQFVAGAADKLDLLKTCGVEVIALKEKHGLLYYQAVAHEINKHA